MSQRTFDHAFDTPIGWIALRLDGVALIELAFMRERPVVDATPTDLTRSIEESVRGYFERPGSELACPLLQLRGTDFQRRVWSVLRRIPVGHTRTYGEIAHELGSGPRAVGGACRANPVPLFVPCHRVVAKTGLGGFGGHLAGSWPAIKQKLLCHEGGRAG